MTSAYGDGGGTVEIRRLADGARERRRQTDPIPVSEVGVTIQSNWTVAGGFE